MTVRTAGAGAFWGGLAALVFGAAVAAASGPVAVAEFEYVMGSVAEGELRGTCEGLGVDLRRDGRSFVVTATDARVRVFETWFNYTLLAPETGLPVYREGDSVQKERVYELPPGPIAIGWPESGRALILREDANAQPFNVTFHGEALASGQGERFHTADHAMIVHDGIPMRTPVGFAPWGRMVQLSEGTIDVRGDLFVHLKEATVSSGDTEVSIPKADEKSTRSTPGATFVMEHHHHGLLETKGASARFDSALGRPSCRGLSMDVDGHVTAYRASGQVTAPERTVPFDRQVLTLAGEFQYEDAPRPADYGASPLEAKAEGEFEAVGLDFAVVGGDDSPWFARPSTVIGAAAAAGLGWAVFKITGALFTRLRGDELLALEGRRRVHEAVVANPGITVNALCELQAMNPFTARYHLDVLRKHGHIRAFKLQREWRYAPADHDVRRLQKSLRLVQDARVRDLLPLVGAEALARDLVTRLQCEWGLSRSGSWKVIDRALRAQLLQKERRGRAVVLRPAS